MLMRKKIAAVIVLMSVLISSVLVGCNGKSGIYTLEIQEAVSFSEDGGKFRVMDRRAETEVANGEDIGIFFNEKSGGISVYDKISGKVWNSLPTDENNVAADFIIEVFYNGKLYVLDSAANCAEKGSITYKKSDGGAVVTYKFKAGELSVEMPVSITLGGTGMNVGIDVSECVIPEGAVLVSVSVLPFLGAVGKDAENASESNYFLVPDGPGAVMYPAADDLGFSSAVFSVYGKEYYNDVHSAAVAAFGVKCPEGAFSATVTKGDECALINVSTGDDSSSGIGNIYPSFIVTPLSSDKGSVKADDSYNGKISVIYEFLPGSEADYIDMAVSVRQALINCGKLSDNKTEPVYPLFVSLLMNTDGSRSGTATTFQQAENLLSILKGKGINDINMILEGAFSGGIIQKKANSLKVLSALGGADDLNALCSYAASQQLNVFAGTALYSSASSAGAAKGISGNKLSYSVDIPVLSSGNEKVYEMYYRDSDTFSSSVSSLLDISEDTGLQGFCITDTENTLAADRSSDGYMYTSFSEKAGDALASVSVDSLLMTDGCNMNIMKYTDCVRNVASDTEITENTSYYSVPFIPAIIHSSYVYSLNAVNSNDIARLALLKCVEYGAAVHYEWCFDSRSDSFYENDLTDAVDFYLQAREDLSDIQSDRITEHFMLETGVYCTGYDSGVRVYVNYNNYSVNIGEVAVMPYDYLRIG